MNSEEVKALISSTTEQKIEEAVQAKLASSEIQAQIDAAIEEQMASDEVQALIAQNIEAQMASEEIQTVIADNTDDFKKMGDMIGDYKTVQFVVSWRFW